MRVETTVDADGKTHKHYIGDPGEHLFLPGPVTGILTLDDGTAINVSPEVIVVADQAQADELVEKIGQRWLETGHPDDVDTLLDPETGNEIPVQRPFVYENADGAVLVGVGDAHGSHPLDEANGITHLDADPRIAQSKES